MLVLSRKTDETIHIGKHIVVKVVRVGRGQVRLGIVAPDSMRITRGELLEDLPDDEVKEDKCPPLNP